MLNLALSYETAREEARGAARAPMRVGCDVPVPWKVLLFVTQELQVASTLLTH
jgi:hypothetical protein